MTRRTALIAAAMLLAAGAVWRLTRPPPPSDEELIRRLFDDAVRAAEGRRVSDAVAGISERFQGQGLDRRGVKQLVAAHTLGGQWLVVRLAGVRSDVKGNKARALVDLVATRAGAGKALADLLPSEGDAWRIDAALEREPDGWRVVGATWAVESLVEALAGPPAPPQVEESAAPEPAPAR